MSSAEFVSNLDGMNGGENFSKDYLKVCEPHRLGPEVFSCRVINSVSSASFRVSTAASRAIHCSGPCE